jgi:hypothetical protein
VITATYGPTKKYEYTSVAGYLLRAGLRSPGGLQTSFSVSLILQSRIDTNLKDLPSFDDRLAGADVWAEDLIISTGGAAPVMRYVFPRIEFEGISSYYTNAQQYHLLHFGYRNGLTPGEGKADQIPALNIANKSKPTVQLDRVRCRGTLAVNADGANEAPLLGVRAYQKKENASVVQMITERCSHEQAVANDTGWLNPLLAQNLRCNNENAPVNLAFKLNGRKYSCEPADGRDPAKCGLNYLYWEERYGLALNLPLPSPRRLSALSGPPDDLPSIDRLVPTLSALQVWKDLDDGRSTVDFLDRAVEVCSVVSGSSAARRFDWRSPRQMPRPEEDVPARVEGNHVDLAHQFIAAGVRAARGVAAEVGRGHALAGRAHGWGSVPCRPVL